MDEKIIFETIFEKNENIEAIRNKNLTEKFAKMSYTHQKEFVVSINEAKKEETRIRRIEKAIEIISKK